MALLPAAAAVVAGGMYLNAKYNIMSDLNNLRTGLLIKKHIENFAKEHGDDDWSFYHTLHQTYGTNEAEEAFVFEGRSWTYKELRAEIGRLALELQRRGVGNRTVVGMFVNNSPEFMFSWFALQKVGAIPAPVNTAIAGEAIRHCLRISEAQYFLVGHELYDTASKALYLDKPGHEGFASLNLPLLNNVFLYDYGTYPASSASASHHNVVILHHTSLPSSPNMDDYPRSSRPKLSPLDTQQYLFTSGTTGLPKAAIWPLAYCHAGNAKGKHPDMWAMPPGKRRRWYICLPMFHGTASFAALPGTFSNSGTVVLARRFSRSTFWEDVRNTRCNAILYIGEMLRYLVQAPVDPRFPDEKAMHDVDLALGLGLAPTIWSGFRERFGVAWICEFYSASEATVSLVNSNRNARGVGKVAHWGPVWRWLQDSFYIIKTDEDGEPIRDPTTGFCIKCKAGEVGESISRIAPPLQRRHDYVGENSEKANSTKTLRDVFAKGDEFSRLGDAMMIVRPPPPPSPHTH
jgi:acyl-CoA synthetase (AMP-forming)/AMP-acid ligase II